MKRINLMFFVLLASIVFSFGQTIHSTTNGGNWEYTTTWIGGSVPTSSNDVVIDGPVCVLNYSNVCNNILINPGKILYATSGWYGQLTIFGNIINNGEITGGANFDIYGNITNNGTWGYPQFNITLKGSDQTITCAENSPITARLSATDSTTNIFLGSDLKLIVDGDNACMFGNAELFTMGHNFTIDEGQFINARVTTNDTVTFINTILSSVRVNGNYALKGLMYAFTDNVFTGTATILDGIINLPGYSTILTFEGNLINYGSIQHSEVHLESNVENYGTWYNQITKFTGTNEKLITNSAGHPFDGVQIIIESAGTIVKCGSAIELSPDHFFLGNGILNCDGFNLWANTIFHNGQISNASQIVQHGYYDNVTIEGSTHLYGTNNMMFSSLNGTVLNHDTITAPYPQAGNVLSVYGHFINEGDYYSLNMDLKGDLTNHGEILSNSLVQVNGNDDQFIYISNHINTEVRFLSMISGTAYQWMKNGTDLNGQLSDMLLFNTLELSDAGVYQCKVTVGGNIVYSREITVNLISGVEDQLEFYTGGFKLLQNYPNPFNGSTQIDYILDNNASVTLKVYDFYGKIVATFNEGNMEKGSHCVTFSSNGLPSGTYFCTLEVNGKLTGSKKLSVAR